MAPAAGLLVALCADAAAQEAPAPLPAGGPALSWTFGDGVRVRVSDMEARIRTRLHMDLLESNLEDVGAALGEDFSDTERLRRARWLTDVRFREGSPLEDVRVRGQVDFASSEIDWKDLFVRHDGAPRFGVLTESNVGRASSASPSVWRPCRASPTSPSSSAPRRPTRSLRAAVAARSGPDAPIRGPCKRARSA